MKRTWNSTLAAIAFVAFLAAGAAFFAAQKTAAHDSPTDVAFLDMMTMHHEDGVKMATMGASKAQNQKVKALAEKMAADQQKDIEEMQAMRQRLFPNVEKADKMKMGSRTMTMKQMMAQAQADMKKLEAASGAQFDNLFLDTFIKHHQMAIEMSKEESANGKEAEVKKKAEETSAKQTAEIGEMRQLKKEVGAAAKTTKNRARS